MKGFMLALALVLLAAQPALAQETFSFQGRLTTPEGTPVADGSYGIQFQLFDASTGGSPRWAEGHSLTTSDGVFSVVLGTKATLNLNAFEEMPYLLLIVDNQEMEPRVPLTAVPYAMKSFRLDEQALVPGQNVSITRLTDGSLQIGSTGGGGGGGGLTSVASDATLTGNGTSSAPLGIADGSVTGTKLANNALLAGANVDIVRRGNGSLEISAAAGGGGGLTQVASDATLSGDGTSGSPLQLADGAVTGVKLADNALVGGSNVTITRQAGGALEVASAGGGLTQVASDGTLSGVGTAGSPLSVAAPLVLTSNESNGTVRGEHSSGNYGFLGNDLAGVYGQSSGSIGAGVRGFSSSGKGVYGESTSGYAGYFTGDVRVIGTLSKNGGSFKIDHPLDPANKYLSHSFVESPDMMNVYNGNVITDANGEATVTLPDYFETLNRDFRYQLTTIGGFAPVYIAEEISGNQFRIAGGKPGMKVSWLVTGIRQDAWAEENRIVVEEDKPASEQGFYLHPKLFGQPQERGLMRALAPERPRTILQIEADRPPPQQ
jgi:hypothetical protein